MAVTRSITRWKPQASGAAESNPRALFKAILLAAAFLALLPVPADAAKGVVAYKRLGCDYFIVSTALGYALLEWYGGSDADGGDVVVGDFEAYGLPNIYNITADTETTVWVEDFWLSRDAVMEKYRAKCGRD